MDRHIILVCDTPHFFQFSSYSCSIINQQPFVTISLRLHHILYTRWIAPIPSSLIYNYYLHFLHLPLSFVFKLFSRNWPVHRSKFVLVNLPLNVGNEIDVLVVIFHHISFPWSVAQPDDRKWVRSCTYVWLAKRRDLFRRFRFNTYSDLCLQIRSEGCLCKSRKSQGCRGLFAFNSVAKHRVVRSVLTQLAQVVVTPSPWTPSPTNHPHKSRGSMNG